MDAVRRRNGQPRLLLASPPAIAASPSAAAAPVAGSVATAPGTTPAAGRAAGCRAAAAVPLDPWLLACAVLAVIVA